MALSLLVIAIIFIQICLSVTKVSYDEVQRNIMANAPLIYKNGSTEYFPYFGVQIKLLFVDPASGMFRSHHIHTNIVYFSNVNNSKVRGAMFYMENLVKN